MRNKIYSMIQICMIVTDKEKRRKGDRRNERKSRREGGMVDDKHGGLRALVSMVSDRKVESRG